MAIDQCFLILAFCFLAFLIGWHQALAVSKNFSVLPVFTGQLWRHGVSVLTPNSLSVLGSFHTLSQSWCFSHTKLFSLCRLKMSHKGRVLLGSEVSEDRLLGVEPQLCLPCVWNHGRVNWVPGTWVFIFCTNKCIHCIGLLWESELIHENA